jgi:hypothetical protein
LGPSFYTFSLVGLFYHPGREFLRILAELTKLRFLYEFSVSLLGWDSFKAFWAFLSHSRWVAHIKWSRWGMVPNSLCYIPSPPKYLLLNCLLKLSFPFFGRQGGQRLHVVMHYFLLWLLVQTILSPHIWHFLLKYGTEC